MRKLLFLIGIFTLLATVVSCSDKGKTAEAISDKDSLPFMHDEGISTLISDSGVVRYKVVAETWDMYNSTNPGTWKFMKGAFLERFDSAMHIDMYAQADTVYYHEQYLWELRGRVNIRTENGTRIRTEELFYDERQHYIWSNKFTRLNAPDKDLQGDTFRSNDKMTDYIVTNTSGSFERKKKNEENPDSTVIIQGSEAPDMSPEQRKPDDGLGDPDKLQRAQEQIAHFKH